ncbi:MAG: GYD domain-containing protein [Thermodesulfobacteriota bacterium]
MTTYIILSRFSPDAFRGPKEFLELAKKVSSAIKEQCPDVKWRHSYVPFGRFDVVDIEESDHPEQIERAAMLIRAHGRSTTETMVARPWKDFLENLSG